MPDHRSPSLLEPESRGGDNAGKGFDFQTNFLISQLPKWLERDGFMSLVQEAIGDIEVKLYSPGYGEHIEMIEVKNYRLTPALFWEEIDRFYAADQGSPNTFQWFRLVVPDISEEIMPLQNGLRRLRPPYNFYSENSNLIHNSVNDFAQLVARANRESEYANFLFRRVLIDTGYGTAQEHGEALFRQNFGEFLTEYRHLPYQVITEIYLELLKLVSRRNIPVTRKAIEQTIATCIPTEHARPYPPVRVHTAFHNEDTERQELVLDWVKFSGGSTKSYPETEEWNVNLLGQLLELKDFILNHRNTRNIRITGSRRLSASLAIGSVFSATGGFTVSMEYRENTWWNTNEHAGTTDIVPLTVEFPAVNGEHLLVCVGVSNGIREAVENYAHKEDASHYPLLNIYYSRAIENARQANSIVAQTKAAILQTLLQTGASRIHLFCAIPAFMALLLGHRLNAKVPIQCYEYIAPGIYIPTCFLT